MGDRGMSRPTGAVPVSFSSKRESVTDNFLARWGDRGVSPYGDGTPWWFRRQNITKVFDSPSENYAFFATTKHTLTVVFLVGDRGVEPLTSTTSKWRSTN